jgi:hypothetical protein
MMVRIAEFTSLVLLAICLMPAGAHVFEMPGKMAMDRDAYFAAQAIYSGWALFGIAIGLGIVTLIVQTWLVRGSGLPAWLAGAAAVLLVVALGWFFLRVYPVNVVTQNWTVVPDNWQAVRAQWESGHAVNAALTFLSFLALCLAVVLRR